MPKPPGEYLKKIYFDTVVFTPLQLEALVNCMGEAVLDCQATGKVPGTQGNRHAGMIVHNNFPCQGDDRWIAISVTTDEEWEALCLATGDPAWARDRRFVTALGRKQHEDELEKLMETWSIGLSAEEAMRSMQGAGLACGVLQNGQDLLGDPQVRERHYFWELDHPEMGRMHHAGNAFNLMGTPPVLRREPLLAEHTESVCRDIIGMSDAEFVDLYQSGVFE